jgi:hypothetical protein
LYRFLKDVMTAIQTACGQPLFLTDQFRWYMDYARALGVSAGFNDDAISIDFANMDHDAKVEKEAKAKKRREKGIADRKAREAKWSPSVLNTSADSFVPTPINSDAAAGGVTGGGAAADACADVGADAGRNPGETEYMFNRRKKNKRKRQKAADRRRKARAAAKAAKEQL